MEKTVVMILGVCGVLFFSRPVLAADLDLNPGKWEFTTTMTMTLMPAPQVMSNTKCFTQEDFQKDPLAVMLEQAPCEMTTSETRGNRMDFELTCKGDMGATSTGKGYISADGDTAAGMMEVITAIPNMPATGGQEMKMVQSWKGRRLGSCD